MPAEVTDGPLTGLDLRRWTGITLAPEDPSQGGAWRFVSFTCRPEAAADLKPSVRVLALSAEQPRSACTATYRLIPGTEVVLSKSAAGPADAREGSARLHITCTDDDSQTLELPKADDSASTSDDPLAVYGDDVSCTVSEPDVGVATGGDGRRQRRRRPRRHQSTALPAGHLHRRHVREAVHGRGGQPLHPDPAADHPAADHSSTDVTRRSAAHRRGTAAADRLRAGPTRRRDDPGRRRPLPGQPNGLTSIRLRASGTGPGRRRRRPRRPDRWRRR